MSSVRDQAPVRDLLESAVPREPRAALTAAEVRALGRRRTRRSRAVGAVIAATAIAMSGIGIVRYVAPSTDQLAPSTTVGPSPRTSYSPTPTPSPTGPDFAALTGTRWLPDLVGGSVATRQAMPEEVGDAPRALLTFEPGHLLVLDYMEKGRVTTVRGTWAATSETPAVDVEAQGTLRLTLPVPARAPSTLVLLLNRLSLVSSFAMFVPENPPPSLAPLTMSAYSNATGILLVDLVKPDIVLPSPYPRRP